MKKLYISSIAVIVILLSCSESTSPDYDKDYNEIKSSGIKEAIALANEWKSSNNKITSYITPKELIVVFPDKRKVNIPLPNDEMYVAIAPYINDTHSCATHYLSSCQGEMVEKLFTVLITDDNGNTIIDEDIETMKNGFFEVWLPRDINVTVKTSYNELVSELSITTDENSNTCFTTAKLN